MHDPGVVARKTPHRFRPKTPEPASPLGEGEDWRGRWVRGSLHGCRRGAHDRKTAHPALSPRRGIRANLTVLVAGDVARLLGPAATLTPTLSLKGEGERGARPLMDGPGSEAGLGFEGRFARKTPHRFRPKTPEPASPLGEGEDWRGRWVRGSLHGCRRGAHDRKTAHPALSPRRGIRANLTVLVAGDVARLLGPAATLTPTLSLKGEGERGGSVWVRRLRGSPLTLALSRRRDLCLTSGGCPEDPHPSPLPRGEGEEQPDVFDEGSGGA